MRVRENDQHFAGNIFKYILLNENYCILIKMLLKFVHQIQVDNKSALVQVMAWCWTADELIIWTSDNPNCAMSYGVARTQWIDEDNWCIYTVMSLLEAPPPNRSAPQMSLHIITE